MRIKKIIWTVLLIMFFLIETTNYSFARRTPSSSYIDKGNYTIDLGELDREAEKQITTEDVAKKIGIESISYFDNIKWQKDEINLEKTEESDKTVKLKIKKIKTNITSAITFEAINKNGYLYRYYITVNVKLIDSVQDSLDNAYKTMPTSSATLSQIRSYVQSILYQKEAGGISNTEYNSIHTKIGADRLKAWSSKYQNELKKTNDKILYDSLYKEYSVVENWYRLLTSKDETVVDTAKDIASSIGSELGRKYLATYHAYDETSVVGERAQSTFESILDKVDSLSKPDDIDDATANKIETAASKVLTAITNVGIVASIIIIAVLGIKYMLGSLEEKAEFKKDMIPYLIGATLLFGITVFVKIFMQIGNSISNL